MDRSPSIEKKNRKEKVGLGCFILARNIKRRLKLYGFEVPDVRLVLDNGAYYSPLENKLALDREAVEDFEGRDKTKKVGATLWLKDMLYHEYLHAWIYEKKLTYKPYNELIPSLLGNFFSGMGLIDRKHFTILLSRLIKEDDIADSILSPQFIPLLEFLMKLRKNELVFILALILNKKDDNLRMNAF